MTLRGEPQLFGFLPRRGVEIKKKACQQANETSTRVRATCTTGPADSSRPGRRSREVWTRSNNVLMHSGEFPKEKNIFHMEPTLYQSKFCVWIKKIYILENKFNRKIGVLL